MASSRSKSPTPSSEPSSPPPTSPPPTALPPPPADLPRTSRICLGFLVATTIFLFGYVSEKSQFDDTLEWLADTTGVGGSDRKGGIVPEELMALDVYSEGDFRNEAGRVPSYWSCRGGACNTSALWGPCYAPHGRIKWRDEVSKNAARHRPYYQRAPTRRDNMDRYDLSGYCRPGFLIIGAGKCGTSSLYHYLVSHPRVLPASEKQIHYFKYYTNYPIQWYYHHFPTATSFLGSGALMTGEASPGYLPYPDVARLVKKEMPGPRIIAIGRNPLERTFSSYNYNYANPTIDEMMSGKFPHIEKGKSKEYYKKYLFSYEQMIRAELNILKECLSRNGTSVRGAEEKYGSRRWARKEYDRRESLGLPPLADLDSFCYGDTVNSTVVRKQWAELNRDHPEKVISSKDLHLKQALVGRSLYTLPLEWWYAVFPEKEIYFMCTEELSDLSGEPMNELGLFLGLPSHNFSTAVREGPYNVGGHRGYDKEISWDEVDINKHGNLSADLKRELVEFIGPYNERLFNLTGRRCSW